MEIISSWRSPPSSFASFGPLIIFFAAKMAREETVDLPTTGAPQPLPQSVHFPALIRPSGTTDGVINTASQSCGNAPGTGQENIAINHSELDDDEVQFVFSVPRRKRKKRKRYHGLPYSH